MSYSDSTSGVESEPNNETSQANLMSFDQAITGQLSSSTDFDYYYVSVEAAGTLRLQFNVASFTTGYDYYVNILDADGNVLAGATCDTYDYNSCGDARNDSDGGLVLSAVVPSSGNYYIRINTVSYGSPPSTSYQVKVSFD